MSDALESANGPGADHIDEKTALQLYEPKEDGAVEHDQQGDFDTSKVQFINGGTKAAEAHVDIDGKTNLKDDQAFVGLSKEELMKFATDPFWIRTRWIMLVLFWVGWFGMLVAAVVIILVAPKCPPRPALYWWQKSAVSEIIPETFYDTNDDGVGDLNGLHQKLNYLSDMNVSAVYLNSITDETDYMNIKPALGTMEDFSNMRAAMHKKGIRLILDFIPNHTSRRHSWFNESRQGTDNEFSNYYVWHAGKIDPQSNQKTVPNNWLSVYGDSAWTFDDVRGEYYLHNYLQDQPELNMSNPAVVSALNDVLVHWLNNGVDGFRVKHFAHLFEGDLNVNEIRSDNNVPATDYDYLVHNLTTFLPETFEMATRWRTLLTDYSKEEGRSHPRLLVVEVQDASADQIEKLYSYNGQPGADMPININLIEVTSGCDALCVQEKVRQWTDVIGAGQTEKDRWSNWEIGNADVSRVSTRIDASMVRAANMLVMTLPGTAFVYYGDEIGMHDVPVSWQQTKDPVGIQFGELHYAEHSRDPYRSPMQWTGGEHAGFSQTNGTTWLPIADDYKERNVHAQSAHGSGVTDLEVFKSLAAIRHEPSLCWGFMEDVIVNNNIYSFVRQAQGYEGYLVAINFGTEPTTVDFHGASPKFVPEKGVVVTSTSNFNTATRMDDFDPGTEMTLKAVHLKPSEGFVVKFDFMG